MQELAETYRRFAERECKDYSPAYYHLSVEVAEDPEVLGFVAQQPVTQPNLLFASVQYLSGPERMPLSSAALRVFLKREGDTVAALIRIRRTQTNEVGPCAALLPAMSGGPIALVEVGASAGLCLLLDKYHYDTEWPTWVTLVLPCGYAARRRVLYQFHNSCHRLSGGADSI